MDEKKRKKIIRKRRNIMSQYFYNISQKILNDRLLLAITSKKNNLSNGFKLKPVITYNLKFVVM